MTSGKMKGSQRCRVSVDPLYSATRKFQGHADGGEGQVNVTHDAGRSYSHPSLVNRPSVRMDREIPKDLRTNAPVGWPLIGSGDVNPRAVREVEQDPSLSSG